MVDTPATRAVASTGLDARIVATDIPSSAEESAALQGIDIDHLLRTIVIRRGAGDYVFVLVPGGRQIDWKKLRTHLGERRLSLPDAAEARAVTGYERGAITPFGSTSAWPVVADATIRGLGTVAIGAGARGVNVHVEAAGLVAALDAAEADVTNPAVLDPAPGGEAPGA
jgi:Cys-tRNA(Pro)/Cys-tRNA(Cys) deacylase